MHTPQNTYQHFVSYQLIYTIGVRLALGRNREVFTYLSSSGSKKKLGEGELKGTTTNLSNTAIINIINYSLKLVNIHQLIIVLTYDPLINNLVYLDQLLIYI